MSALVLRYKLIAGLGVLLAITLACNMISQLAQQPPSPATQEAAVQQTIEAMNTQSAQLTQAVPPSPTSEPSLTPTKGSDGLFATKLADSATQNAARVQTATAVTVAQKTQEAQTMNEKLLRVMSDGILPSSLQTQFFHLKDFNESWAQIGWYQWWYTDHSAESFVLAADTAWESASDRANWYDSGCGVVFDLEDKQNHHLAYLGLDGVVYIARVSQGNWKTFANKRYGKVSIPKGEAQIILVVYDKKITYYVNDTRVVSVTDNALKGGRIALTLLSGTNAGFGTRCQMTNIGLWIIR